MRFWFFTALILSAAVAQVPGTSADLANMREDVRLLSQRVGELTLRVEQLERDNSALQRKADTGAQAYATVAQLNEAVAEMNRLLKAAIASSKEETLQHVAAQMEKLASQTNEAIESLARRQSARVAAPSQSGVVAIGGFSDNFPKEGIKYVVQKGDTLAKIAQKTGAKTDDIINANKISDPSKIQVGQVLFIPGAK
ncbi:MAG: LysM peptidoglycan-binding domain-containing protein [Opitutaceae bacterium]|jgi:LysM repeat protein